MFRRHLFRNVSLIKNLETFASSLRVEIIYFLRGDIVGKRNSSYCRLLHTQFSTFFSCFFLSFWPNPEFLSFLRLATTDKKIFQTLENETQKGLHSWAHLNYVLQFSSFFYVIQRFFYFLFQLLFLCFSTMNSEKRANEGTIKCQRDPKWFQKNTKQSNEENPF